MSISAEQLKRENMKVYSAEARIYDFIHPEVWNWYEQRRYRRLVRKTLSFTTGKTPPVVADVGAGTGNLTLKYLNAGCCVYSIDISREMLDVLESKLTPEQRKCCTILCLDVESALQQIPRVDGVCFSSVLHHIYDYESLISAFLAKLNGGGFFFNIHDPLIQEPKSQLVYRIHKMIARIDESLYKWNTRRHGYDLKQIHDDSIAEFHQHRGTMSHSKLLEMLYKESLLLEHFETYVSRRYGLLGWLATEVFGAENCFACIAVKQI